MRAIAQAADEVGKALTAGDLDAALAVLAAARDLSAQGRRVIKVDASGRRVPATRPGALRDLVEEHLRAFPGKAFTPRQVGKVLTRSAGAVANALDKLVALGVAQMVTDKPRSYRLAPAPDAAGDPGVGAGDAQRRVNARQRGQDGRDGTKPPLLRRPHVYLLCDGGYQHPVGLWRCQARRDSRATPSTGYIRALTCAGTRQVHERTIPGVSCPAARYQLPHVRQAIGPGRVFRPPLRQQRGVFAPLAPDFGVRWKKGPKTGFL